MRHGNQCRRANVQLGVSLIELLVALVIGALLIVGTVSVYVQSRNSYRVTESVARLQETSRYALDILETEIRMANFWGLNNRADSILNRAAPGEPLPAALNTAAAGINECGPNWAIDLDRYIEGENEVYALACAAFNGAPQPGSDILVIRRASHINPEPLETNRLHVQSSRLQGTIFIPACTSPTDPACIPPGFAPPASESHDLLVSAFYVAQDSTGVNGLPSLRRKRLVAGPGGADIVDEEVIPGIESLQVQFGVDNDDDQNADQYLDPDAVAVPVDRVVSVRIWLLVRAENIEVGFQDNGVREFPPGRVIAAPGDNIRRILVERTLQLRNTRA